MDTSPRGRRLLVISYHFPPDRAVGGQRWGGLSKYLTRLGWEVHVVTAAADPDGASVPGVHRHQCRRRWRLLDLYTSLRAKRNAVPPSRSGPAARRPSLRGQVRKVIAPPVRGILGVMAFPDIARGWILSAAVTARSVLRTGEFDAVVSSGPPHAGHIAAFLSTLGRREEFWMDMRDPWVGPRGSLAEEGFRSAGAQWVGGRIQRFLFKRASRIIVNTRKFADVLLATDPTLPVVWVPNGIDYERLPDRPQRRFDGCSLCYVGTMYMQRNLSTVLAAMAELVRDRPQTANVLKLRIAGSMDPSQQLQLETEIAVRGLANLVELKGMLPSADALELLNRSQLAIVLAQDQPLQVPAKLYECVGLGVPTLVIAEPDSSSASEAQRIGAMAIDAQDVAGMRVVLERLIAGENVANTSSIGVVSYEELASIVNRLLRGSPGPEVESEITEPRPLLQRATSRGRWTPPGTTQPQTDTASNR